MTLKKINVLFSGRGNSAFEVADSIYGSTSVIHMIARSRVRLSWATHYVGDLRYVTEKKLGGRDANYCIFIVR